MRVTGRNAIVFALLATSGCRQARTNIITESTAVASPRTETIDAADAGRVTDPGKTAEASALTQPAPIKPPAPLPPLPSKVKINIRSRPRAMVSWGKKSLGMTPVTVERPRDSGPMDLVLRAQGYLHLHARAYTFRSDSLSVEMTKTEDQGKLLGAKKAPPPPPPPGSISATVVGETGPPTTTPAPNASPASPDGGVLPPH